MSIQKITIEYYRLFLVTFPEGEEGERTKEVGYFETEIEAQKVASLKRGCWGVEGRVMIKDFKTASEVPNYYKKAGHWARKNLTAEEYEDFI